MDDELAQIDLNLPLLLHALVRNCGGRDSAYV